MLMALIQKCYRPSIIETVASFTEQISGLLLSGFSFITLPLQEKQAATAGLLRRVQKQPLQAAYCGAF